MSIILPTTLIEGKTAVAGQKISSGVAFAPCRTLWVGTAGTATITDLMGNILTDFPLFQGENPIGSGLMTLTTAADVWALY